MAEIIEEGEKINLEQKFEAKCSNCGTRFTFLHKDTRKFRLIECPTCSRALDVCTCKKFPDSATPTT